MSKTAASANQGKHYLIYISGLGDGYDSFRKFTLKFWRIWGVRTQLVPMQWNKEMPFAERLQRITGAIESAKKQGYIVSVIGESAGGSIAVSITSQRTDIYRLVTICGTVNSQMTVAPVTLKRSPGFGKAMEQMNNVISGLNLKHVHTVSALVDKIVAAKYTRIPGANNHVVFSVGHLFTVALCLTFLSWYIVGLVKR